jgi:hypothetical protein
MAMRRLFLAAPLVAAVLILAACGGGKTASSSSSGSGSSGSPVSSGSGTDSGQGSSSDPSDSASSGGVGVDATAVSFEDCHEYKEAGGNSDGVVVVDITGVPDGTGATLTTSAGESPASVEDGSATFLVKLTSIGEVITIDDLSVAGQDFSGADLGIKEHTVGDASNCGHHPSEDE